MARPARASGFTPAARALAAGESRAKPCAASVSEGVSSSRRQDGVVIALIRALCGAGTAAGRGRRLGHNAAPSFRDAAAVPNALLDTIETTTGAKPVFSVIWLHGLGADGHDFAPIVPELVRREWPALRFVFPHAPVQPITINNGYPMRAWYDIVSLDFSKVREDAAGVRRSIAEETTANEERRAKLAEAQARVAFTRLRALGVGIWLDDFGTGFSGLSHLRRVPVDGVKIDRSFITDLLRDPNDLALTTGVIAMSHSLGVTVVAEGIENVGQHDMLRERGCPLGQGFHLGHPLPPGEIERLFG